MNPSIPPTTIGGSDHTAENQAENPYILKPGTKLTPDSYGRKKQKVQYKILGGELPSEARHSFSYRAILLRHGKETKELVFIKTPRLSPDRGEDDKTRMADIHKTFLREYEKQERLVEIKEVSHYLSTGRHAVKYNNVEVQLPFLAQQFIEGTKLDEYYREQEQQKNGVPFSGVKDAAEWFSVARALVTVIKRVHNQQIVHGDIGPRNILMVPERNDGDRRPPKVQPYIVDFGQSFLIDQDVARPGRGMPTQEVRAGRPPERDRDSSWQIPADIYGIGHVLYYLATGAATPASAKAAGDDVEKLKAEIHSGIMKANPVVLRQNEGIVKIVDKCLRNDPHDRYFCAENILSDLDTFEYKPTTVVPDQKQFDLLVKLIRQTFKVTTSVRGNHLFGGIILKNLDMLAKKSESMRRDHFEIYGDRDEIIDHLCRYLSTLRQGDVYLTVTQPSYWSKHNLGTNGRFFTMNKIMARRGVIIRRVFLVPPEELRQGTETWRILEAHQNAVDELMAEGVDVDKKELSSGKSDQRALSYYTGFKCMTHEERKKYFESEGNHVALWRRADGTMMSIVFSTKPLPGRNSSKRKRSEHQIVKVRFWASNRLKRPYDELLKLCVDSTPLSEAFKISAPAGALRAMKKRRLRSNPLSR